MKWLLSIQVGPDNTESFLQLSSIKAVRDKVIFIFLLVLGKYLTAKSVPELGPQS